MKAMTIMNVDKKAYLSALALSENIVVTCDSSSMISEAALTGKCFIVSKLVHSHLYNKGFSHVVRLSCHYNDVIRSHQTNGPVGTTSLVDGIASQVDGIASQVAAGIAGQR